MRIIDADVLGEFFREKQNEITKYASYRQLCDEDKERYDRLEVILEKIDSAPTIDPESLVKRGEWIEDSPYRDEDGCLISQYHCSICGRYEDEREPFCNCGAKMTED